MFERPIDQPIVIGQRFRWRYVDSNEPSEEAAVVNVRTDREEGFSPEVMDYMALWIEAKYVQNSPKAKTLYDCARCGQADLHRGQRGHHRTPLVLQYQGAPYLAALSPDVGNRAPRDPLVKINSDSQLGKYTLADLDFRVLILCR